MDLLREPHPTSQIAQERVMPGPPAAWFVAAAVVLGLGVAGLAGYAGMQPEAPFPVEKATAGSPGSLYFPAGLHAARLVSAVAAGAAVVACALAARRLSHSDGVGILAGALVALDPGLLALGRLATPETIALAGLMGALACFLSVSSRIHWLGALLLAVAAVVDPRALAWSLPLAVMAVLRGHIYAAPRHLGIALLQTVGAPLAGALVHLVSGGPGFTVLACGPMPLAGVLLLESPLYGNVASVHGPVTWFAGLGALALMAGGALWSVSSQFRMARLPGRIQLRLAQPMPAAQARVLWVFALAVAAPFPIVWLPVFAIALAFGVGLLSEDAPGFGLAVGLVLVAFAGVALVRGWPLVHGVDDPVTLARQLVPWSRLVPCAG